MPGKQKTNDSAAAPICRRANCLIISLAILLIFCLVFFIALCISLFDESQRICLSEKCIRSASIVAESMNRSADPCDDFYGFVCGRWTELHPDSGRLPELSKLAQRKSIEFLEETISHYDQPAVVDARKMYRACMNYEAMEKYGVNRLKEVISEVGLSFLPPLDSGVQQPLSRTLANAIAKLKLDILASHIWTEDCRIVFMPPFDHIIDKQSPLSANYATLWPNNWVLATVNFLDYFRILEKRDVYAGYGRDVEKAARTIYRIYIELKTNVSIHKTGSSPPETMTLDELQSVVDKATASNKSKIDWKEYVRLIMEYSSEQYGCIDIENYIENGTVIVYDITYFEKLSKAIEKFEDHELELGVWMQIMYTLAPHVNIYMEELKRSMDVFIGIDWKYSRDVLCARVISGLVDLDYLQALKRGTGNSVTTKVEDMVTRIMVAAADIIANAKWMDDATRAEAVREILHMDKLYGYTVEPTVDAIFDVPEYINKTTHLANLLNVLSTKADSEANIWSQQSGLITVHYDTMSNTIRIPDTILAQPFFDNGLEALNYGMLGTMVAREIAHAFNYLGRIGSEVGVYNRRWSDSALAEYKKRKQCFIDEIYNYVFPSSNENVWGSGAVEDLASDVSGLNAAYLAYDRLVDGKGPEQSLLPGFEDYTHRQLFFIGYGSMLCGHYCEGCRKAGGPRIGFALKHSQDFARAFNCPIYSNMNPAKKCKLWGG